MRIIIVENYDKMSEVAADIMAAQLILKPNSVLGLATGSTPKGMYNHLIDFYNEGKISFNDVITYNLDEYYGLTPDNDQSYHYFMYENLFSKVDIKDENVNIPSGTCIDIEGTCKDYDSEISDIGGTDIQVLGIGVNGHIGFNEPGEHFVGETHLVDLDSTTIEANSRFFEREEDVPRRAISMGMKSIMGSKKILLLASGSAKAKAIYETVKGKIDPKLPASILQLHQDVIIVVDKEAGELIKDLV